MNKFVTAAVLGLGIGLYCSGQVLARESRDSQTSRNPRDTTSPVITAELQGTQGDNGWYTSTVNVTWNVSDPESRIRSKSGCDPVSVTSDTTGLTYTCTATSQGGTSTQSITVIRVTVPPAAVIITPGGNATYTQGQTIAADYNCTDAVSGISTCIGTVADGVNIDLESSGDRSFSVNAADLAGNSTIASVSYTVGGEEPPPVEPPPVEPPPVEPPVVSDAGTRLFAWNDLGMHCADSDFSVFTLLPPFNDLNAQLVVNSRLVNAQNNSDYTLTYEATPDPAGSVNSSSINKTNFWDFDQVLFGADLPADVGLTGNPMASYTPAPLVWSDDFQWYDASGIPITPVDDDMKTNYFPMVKVTARDSSGKAIASTTAVLPVSSEINCGTCHASDSGSAAARPAGGWVNLSPGSEKDWRTNVLRLHDEINDSTEYDNLLTEMGYSPSLESSAANGTPILCDICHNSNALAVWGIVGDERVSNMTAAMHNRHAYVSLPGETQPLNNIGTRESCYNCHPGQDTQCLRGAMGNPVDANGDHSMECQSCHGSMATVGNAAREGWFDMPTCQSCHHDGIRETVAINTDGTFKTWDDTRFASNPDTPSEGWSLFRFSTGHGNLQCEACHNSTHAEFTDTPSANGNEVNDNFAAIQAQGYAAAIRECTVCHQNVPNTTDGGPHGMHTIGQYWVKEHHDAFNNTSVSSCYYCHGDTSSGSPLAVVKVEKTFNNGDGRSKTFAANERVTCWSCHNGPNP